MRYNRQCHYAWKYSAVINISWPMSITASLISVTLGISCHYQRLEKYLSISYAKWHGHSLTRKCSSRLTGDRNKVMLSHRLSGPCSIKFAFSFYASIFQNRFINYLARYDIIRAIYRVFHFREQWAPGWLAGADAAILWRPVNSISISRRYQ